MLGRQSRAGRTVEIEDLVAAVDDLSPVLPPLQIFEQGGRIRFLERDEEDRLFAAFFLRVRMSLLSGLHYWGALLFAAIWPLRWRRLQAVLLNAPLMCGFAQ